jgi:hypothetical protein
MVDLLALLHVCEVPGSNLGAETEYAEVSYGFTQSFRQIPV